MSRLYVWLSVPVNKSKRPILLENEFNIYVKDGVGIYQGKLKICDFQNGRVYLTNRRVIYVDTADLARAIAVSLRDVSRAEYVEKFLRSSPKVKLYLKHDDDSSNSPGDSTSTPYNLLASLPLDKTVDWICVICLFNNHLSSKTDLETNFPKCTSCGIPPSRKQIERVLQDASNESEPAQVPENSDQCPKCTFINHPSMKYCEICGTELRLIPLALSQKIRDASKDVSTPKAQNPLGLVLETPEEYTNGKPYLKVSFRKGGDTGFYEHVVKEIDKLKWEALENRGGISGESTKLRQPQLEVVPKLKSGGIHSLERLGQLQRKQNEILLTLSLEDFEQLMHKAQDLIKISSSFGALVKRRKNVPVATIPPLAIRKSSSLYHQELARHISEFLLNFELTRITSMIALPDLYASYNRFRVLNEGFGTELITTQDLTKSMSLLDSLQLPIKLTTFQSGLEVVTQRSHELQDLHVTIMEYLITEENQFKFEKFKAELLADTDDYVKDKYRFFRGNTVAEIAEHFGWSHAVCIEELERCMDEQLVVFDRHILGTFYFANKFDADLGAKILDDEIVLSKVRKEILAQQRNISTALKSDYDASQSLVALVDHEFGTIQLDVSSLSIQSPSPAPIPPTGSLGELAGLEFT